MRERKKATGLYNERIGGVQFLSQNLFRATCGSRPTFRSARTRRAHSCSNGMFIKETSAQLAIRKSGFEQTIFRSRRITAFCMASFAVSLAMLTGWLGSLVFRKD